MIPQRSGRMFWAYLVAFVAMYVALYPATYAIEDEFNILSLAVSLTRGTVLLDRAGLDLDADLLWHGHRISKFSPFHAALLAPAILSDWRLAFAMTALFTVGGAFVFRGMLRREGLSSGWVALYYLCPGIWFYSRTLMAAVPASVMVLLGASFLLRERSRPGAAGVALSVGALFHPWMIPVSAALSLGWWLDAPRARVRPFMTLLATAAPAAALLLVYNTVTTGSPLLNAYSLLGTQYGFKGENVGTFGLLYAGSLLVMPLAGWAALSRRWSGSLAVPVAVGTVLVMASLYYFRDGIGYGPAGLLPGQRFLIPASMLACLPAARFLSHHAAEVSARFAKFVPATALACFVIGFAGVSAWHGAFLGAHAAVQAAIRTSIPDGATVLVGDRAFKEFAPVLGTWRLVHMRGNRMPSEQERAGAYAVWISAPENLPPPGWFRAPAPLRVPARSWMWSRDVWIGQPAVTGIHP
ncbi:MAG: hypothetical protein ABIP65_02055 [Vicinamibacterales bacterium]